MDWLHTTGVHFSSVLCSYLPDAAFWSLKLALLLSLVPGDTEDRPIAVLIVGDDPLVNRLVAAASRFAKTGITFSSTADLLPTFCTDASLPMGTYIDPGMLLLADDSGLVRFPFLNHLKPAQMLQLAGAMETQTTAAKIPTRKPSPTLPSPTYPAQQTFLDACCTSDTYA